MNLISYLDKHFYTKDKFLALSKVTNKKFMEFQTLGIMPSCSYLLKTDISCHSFFGEHKEQATQEYYAKGNLSWLGTLLALHQPSDAFPIFKERYQSELNRLKDAGFTSNDPRVTSKIDQHILEEWGYFIDGTYGLCTKTGLPEDIAAKELAILIINNLLNTGSLSDSDITDLGKAVDLLDNASSLFAPHERPDSSRQRLVVEIRRKYKL
ncbi:MAG TPA: hypothetical protein ENI91_08745 [Sphingomonadales bacterium]|nr:hypothetical protein [Sphingomonadales bacterium]